MTRSAGRTIPVYWQRGQAGPKGTTVIHGWINTGSMAKKLDTTGADNVSEWRLISTTVDLFVRDVGPPWVLFLVERIKVPHMLASGGPGFCTIEDDGG